MWRDTEKGDFPDRDKLILVYGVSRFPFLDLVDTNGYSFHICKYHYSETEEFWMAGVEDYWECNCREHPKYLNTLNQECQGIRAIAFRYWTYLEAPKLNG